MIAREAALAAAPRGDGAMEIDTDRIDEAVLALLYLGLHDRWRAWKGFDWDALDRLHEKGMISNPASKAKSVVFTEVGPGLSTPVRRTLRFAMPPVAARFAAMMSPALPRCPILACARPQGHAGRHASADPGDEAEG
jgi:hypothetical protein